jgi:hypothetical protein
MEKNFWNKIKKLGRSWLERPDGGSGIQLREWRKTDWTYHAKGFLFPFFFRCQ